MDRPVVLDLTKRRDLHRFKELRQSGIDLLDVYDAQRAELSELLRHSNHPISPGNWVYYPWKSQMIHLLAEPDYYQLRTLRNYPLIAHTTQTKLHHLTIGVAGLSVGSNVAKSLVYAGIGHEFRLADPDVLATSNLNRITGNLLDVGQNKTVILARQLWELDPYLDLALYEEGIHGGNLVEFFTAPPQLAVLFDEVDDLGLKVHLRLAARAARVVYCMVTDNGYSGELDVVRFDRSASEGGMQTAPRVDLGSIASALKMSEKIELSPQEEQALINSLIGSKHRAPEMQRAGELKLKRKISGWPQLQAVAGVGAAMAVYALCQYVDGKLESGKKVISLS